MEALLNRRKVLKGRVTRIENILEEHGVQPLGEVTAQLYLKKLNTLSDEIDQLQQDISGECLEDEFEVHDAQYNTLIGRVEAMTIRLMTVEQNSTTISSVPNSATGTEVKLPRLELPVFNGKYDEWLSFRDLFTATVHNNSTLSSAQKLQYLKSSVRQDAALLIQSIPITDGNYQEAWDTLLKRYNHNREIIDSYIQKLFKQPNIAHESATALRHLLDTTNECIRALKVLKQPVQHWDSILLYILREKMDQESRRQWELAQKDAEEPTFKNITSFLEQRARALAVSQPNIHSDQSRPTSRLRQFSQSKQISAAAHHGIVQPACPICHGPHSVFKCSTFLGASVNERRDLVKKHELCYNCLKLGHPATKCKAGHCKKCSHKHNTLIHQDGPHDSATTSSRVVEPEVMSHMSKQSSGHRQVLLSTAVIQVRNFQGELQPCRALLDSASQTSFITERCAQQLRLKRKPSNVTISGINSTGISTASSSLCINIRVTSSNSEDICVETLITPNVTTNLPNFHCDPSNWAHIKGLQLADPTFHKPGTIDILLGADVYNEVICPGQCKGPPGTPSALNTVFGWVLSGPIGLNQPPVSVKVHHCSINNQLKKFWELEELPEIRHLTTQEQLCETIFYSTHSRDSTGRYVVRLPFKNSTHRLGESRKTAIRRFQQLEHRLQGNNNLYNQYKSFLDEYLSLGHMEAIRQEEIQLNPSRTYYLPHHAVFKDTSTTTKLRVVFDASAKTTTGHSLNDELLVGPRIQDELLSLLIRFRFPVVAMVADLEKMYRQIWIHPDDRDFQRIIWRNHPTEPLKDYRLLTVTYGTASAPYLATKVLQQLAKDEGARFPLAATVLTQDFYVDDLMTGANSTEEALRLQAELIQLTQQGGFNLRKWVSNHPLILDAISPELREIQLPFQIDNEKSVKTLGLQWHPATDHLSFTATTLPEHINSTKRTILSDIARIFDPLGLLAPVTIRAKLMLQELWQLKSDWDDHLPRDLEKRWQAFRDQLDQIRTIKIQRCVGQSSIEDISLHGFCDASERAFAAAVYLRTMAHNKGSQVYLIAAKTRVAPLKTTSLPRLELCGAVLLARLIRTIQSSLRRPITEVHAWSDSTITLSWLSSSPQRWKTFVANRVAEVQTTIPNAKWHHISSEENPADCASRGISATELLSQSLWWHGPHWLLDTQFPETNPALCNSAECAVEERKIHTIVAHTRMDESLLTTFSSLSKLKRVTAFVHRFINNCRLPATARQIGPISKQELDSALLYWVKVIQHNSFGPEIEALRNNKPLPSKGKVTQLHPYLDHNGILRVGGRLRYAKITPDQAHPILLSHRNKLVQLLIDMEHKRLLHGGLQLVMSTLQQRFWIIGARDAIRHHIRRCIPCVRQRAETAQQLMGDLPPMRVNPARPFLKCGVDFAGPFQLRLIKGRGQHSFKSYLAVFVCFVTRAVHLELVSALTTDAFLAALKRFVARRGKCSDIFSDCGTNFIGADRELKKFINYVSIRQHTNEIYNWLANEGISWHFSPPAAPHFGGLWEAGVRSVKYHLKRVLGPHRLTYEEMETLLCQIEACLNSRPLTALSSDPNDLTVLTPGHFIIGDSLSAIPEPDLTSINSNRLSRWQLGQQMLQHFWRRWKREYLVRLQQRPKWAAKRENIKIGELVLLKEDDLPPTKWKMARVCELHPGEDNCVRVVTVKLASGQQLKRPIVKICPLPLD
ncbi:uncharacterized protein [Centruroides vittatus]|uniref:uncharacterized protein n=1 Tax=Centruroides vittatus TaxID=120091 RepID=UPI003510ACE0